MSEGSVVYVIGGDAETRSRSVEALRTAGFSPVAYEGLDALSDDALYTGPSCICLDGRFGSPTDASAALKRYGGKAPLLVLLDEPDLDAAVEWMRNGAADVMAPPHDGMSLATRVRVILDRDGAEVRHRQRRRQILGRMATLTRREGEVMGLVVSGRSNKKIAEIMGVSIKTVEVHRSRVMRKMEARSLAELVEQNLFVGQTSGSSNGGGDSGADASVS